MDGNGYQIVVERELLKQVGGLSVDFQGAGWRAGFSIRTGQQPEDDGCGSCSC